MGHPPSQARITWFLVMLLLVMSAASSWAKEDPAPTPNTPPAGKPISVDHPAQMSVESTDEMDLFQDIPSVFSASKYEQKKSSAPSHVTIITAAEIRRCGYRTLADILSNVVSFYITYDRNYTYLGVRGFNRPGDYNSRVLLLINGHRINDVIYDGASIGHDAFLDLATIEKVEIIRGPSSSLYGTNAFFAVINVITKRGRDVENMEAWASWASHNTYRGVLSGGKRFSNGIEAFVSAAAYDSLGPDLYYQEFDTPEQNQGLASKGDYERYYKSYASLAYRDLALQGGYAWRRKGIPTASFDTVFNDSRNQTIDARSFIELKYSRPFFSWLDLTGRAYYDHYDYRGKYIYLEEDDAAVVNHDTASGKRWGVELSSVLSFWRWFSLVGGGEIQHNFQQDQHNYDASAVYLDQRRDSWSSAVFLQGNLQPVQRLELSLGLRLDYYNSFGMTLNPRLAAIYHPWSRTSIKLLYGSAFRAPTTYEAFYHDGYNTAKPAAGLEPETVKTGELILEQELWRPIRTTASLYYSSINNLIDLRLDSSDNYLVFQNVEAVRAVGVEIAAEGRWPGGLEGHASYAWQDSMNRETERWLTNSPKHMAKMTLLLPLIVNKISMGIVLQYLSSRRTLADQQTDPYLVLHLTLLAQQLVRGLTLSGSIFNFFDKTYSHPGSSEHRQDVIQQNGRTFWLELTYNVF